MDEKVKTFLVSISGTATATVLVEAKDEDEADEATERWLEQNRPERVLGAAAMEIDGWGVELGSTEVWRDGKPLPESLKAREILGDDMTGVNQS
jgi:hypothetical protein